VTLAGHKLEAYKAVQAEAKRVSGCLDAIWEGLEAKTALPSVNLDDALCAAGSNPEMVLRSIAAWAERENVHDEMADDLTALADDANRLLRWIGGRL
jgi:hypothetical protein